MIVQSTRPDLEIAAFHGVMPCSGLPSLSASSCYKGTRGRLAIRYQMQEWKQACVDWRFSPLLLIGVLLAVNAAISRHQHDARGAHVCTFALQQ